MAPSLGSVGRARWVGGGLFGAAVAVAVGLGSGAEPSEPSFEVAGCDGLSPEPTCFVVSTSTLTLWFEGPATEWRVDGISMPVVTRRTARGQSASLSVSSSAEQIALELASGAVIRVGVQRLELPPWQSELERSIARGAFEGAKSRLLDLGEPEDPLARAHWYRHWARLAWRGVPTATPTWTLRDRAARAALGAGLAGLAAEETINAGNALLLEGDQAGALERVQAALGLAEGRLAYVLLDADLLASQIAVESGDFRTAVETAHRVELRAELLGEPSGRWWARRLRARVYQELGRAEETLEILDALIAEVDEASCEGGGLLSERGAAVIAVAEAGGVVDREKARRGLEQALHVFERVCPSGPRRAVDRLNLAALELIDARPEAARVQLERAAEEGAESPGALRSWFLDLDGRRRLLSGRPSAALEVFEVMAEEAKSLRNPSASWRAMIGRAEALRAQGRVEDALRAYEDADAFLLEWSVAVALREGRAAFLASHARSLRGHVQTLLDAGREADSVVVVRRARRRWLDFLDLEARVGALDREVHVKWARAVAEARALRRELDRLQSEGWALADSQRAAHRERVRAVEEASLDALEEALRLSQPRQAELPPLRSGELRLGFARTDAGWMGYGLVAGQPPRVLRLEAEGQLPGRAELGRKLFEPFADLIAAAERIVLLPSGALERIDLHALPHRGRPLLAHAPVVYALDLMEGAPREHGVGPRLVVTDPREDLEAARAEGADVARLLRSGGGEVQTLAGSEATEAALRARLGAASHFHFAGHARADGGAGWQSGLALAGEARLDTGDILALGQVPPTAVLAGCETARTETGVVVGLGVAQAFLLAGARTVVASVRPVEDTLLAQFSRRLYAIEGDSFEHRAWRALLELAESAPDTDWAALRVLVR